MCTYDLLMFRLALTICYIDNARARAEKARGNLGRGRNILANIEVSGPSSS